MKRTISLLLAVLLLFSAGALADLRRGDRGEEVRSLQQMLLDTGFIFEEPDGVFGGKTEKAVKWFQKYARLEQTGVVDDKTLDSLYACWLQIMEENGVAVPASEDPPEPQTAGLPPDDRTEGDYPVCCLRYTTEEGDEHIEPCGRHAQLAEDVTLSAADTWTNELAALYDEWLALSPVEDRAAIASSRAFFTLWLEQQTAALKKQNNEDADARVVRLLRNQCAELCGAVYALQAE